MAEERKLTVSDLRAKLDRARAIARTMREEGQEIAQRGIEGVVTVAGGATVGMIRGLWGDETTGNVMLPGVDFEADIAIGAGLQLVAVMGVFGKEWSPLLNAYASGVNACIAGRELEQALRAGRKKK